MKPPYAMMALAATVAAPIALAQVPAPPPSTARPPATMTGGNLKPVSAVPALSPAGNVPPQNAAPAGGPAPASGAASAPKDARVYESSTALPAPVIPDANQQPSVALPTEPIEPFLLTRDNGPFMVMAKTFRGPDAERWALALVLELRNDYQLPAYILRTRDFPMRSNIREVPPTAIQEIRRPYVSEPEKSRTHDEAVVLVGNEKTVKDADELLHRVKKIKPKCLNQMHSIYPWRDGLGKALRTTNPFVPAQELFPRKTDPMVTKLNGGQHSIFRCPGHYSLQVAEFTGRSTFNVDDKRFKPSLITDSPLEQAFDSAEELAEVLAKDPEVRKTGCLPYVYHDRTTSKVLMGAFNAPDDPAAGKLRNTLLHLAVPLAQKKNPKTGNPTAMIVPADVLTDVEVLKASVQAQ
jgi:hypothetical protein